MRFGSQPFTCDREGVKCFKCSQPIAIGQPLNWDFEDKHRWCVPCSEKAADEGSANDTNVNVLVEILTSIKAQLDRIEANTTFGSD